MTTINYQGQKTQVEQVCVWSGDLAIRPQAWHGGDEEIYRDAAGRYYLARCLHRLDLHGPTERRASFGLHVHRISLKTAALWAVVRGNNGEGSGLRADLNAALQPPASTSATRQFADGRMAVTGRFSVELDELASAVLRRVCREGDDCRDAGEDPRDLVNAAVTFYLCDGRNDVHDDFDLNDGDDALERAKQDRLKAVHDKTAFPVVEPDPHPYATPVREITGPNDSGVRRFVFTYPPYRHTAGRRMTVEVTDAQWQEVQTLAVQFQMRAPYFLRALAVGHLPGQPWFHATPVDRLEHGLQAEHIAFSCLDTGTGQRVERAAQACNQTVEEFAAVSVGSIVDSWEENMLVHPVTGALLRADQDDMFDVLHVEAVGPHGHTSRDADRADVSSPATTNGSEATLSTLVSPETLEAAARYTAEHGLTVEEAVAGLLEGFAKEAMLAADRPDVALCAAAAPSGDGDEENDEPLPDGEDEDEPEKKEQQ